nr:PREDICTED: hydroxylysine kinase [Lepisosteus oculatus]XP_015216863.1 PREDICTED: hydroxylysine kinase [Lepisosteus oculatus]XP_015216864.1 PREDICTED: hydroxylysine kinase [Lepisosteus oculatus]
MSTEFPKPHLSEAQARELVERVFGLRVDSLRPLPSYDDQNFHVAESGGGEYVLKIMNSADSHNSGLIEVQTHTMMFLRECGLPTSSVARTQRGETMSLETIDCGSGSKGYIVRLLTYLPGTPVAKIPSTPQILYEVGRMAAMLNRALLKMEHPQLQSLKRENFFWSLYSVPLIESYLFVMDGDPIQHVVRNVIQLYKRQIQPRLGSFRQCILHGDFNDHNILIEPDGPAEGALISSEGQQLQKRYRISGILDFGDMSWGCLVFEVAITIMYMMIESQTPMEVGGPVLAGYESVTPLTEEERDVVFLLVLCRFCQSLVRARHTVLQDPENEEYLMITSRKGGTLLAQLWEMGKEVVERLWFDSARSYQSSRTGV